jgi:hypothetical protein
VLANRYVETIENAACPTFIALALRSTPYISKMLATYGNGPRTCDGRCVLRLTFKEISKDCSNSGFGSYPYRVEERHSGKSKSLILSARGYSYIRNDKYRSHSEHLLPDSNYVVEC